MDGLNKTESNLKPCPFCGSTDIFIYTDEAVANWNRRPYDGHKCSECESFCCDGKTAWCTHVRELVETFDEACEYEACELFEPKSERSDKNENS